MLDTESLITRYRPQSFKQVVGHREVVASLRDAVVNRTAHAFLFAGASGLGKTTLARLVAKGVGASGSDVIEIDAAVYTGVDDMRSLTEGLRYRPFGESEIKVVILDECHRISAQGFSSLLKFVEEPPPWVYWMFCTTDPTRIPETIRTRCLAYQLKPVGNNDLFDLLDKVAGDEGIEVDGGVLDICVKQAAGSPRQALANLAACAQCQSRDEAVLLLRSAVGHPEAFRLARALVEGKGWETIQPILKELSSLDPESIRHAVREYVTKVILDTNSPEKAQILFPILDAFSTPLHHADRISGVVLAVGRCLSA